MINFFKGFTWRKVSYFLKSAFRKISPFADKALDIAKPLLLRAYDSAVDAQQEKFIEAYRQYGPRFASKIFDQTQMNVCSLVEKATIVPQKWRDAACLIIEDEGNRFQRQLIETAKNQGEVGLNGLIDTMQMEVKERIKAL